MKLGKALAQLHVSTNRFTPPATLKIGAHTVRVVVADHWQEDAGNFGEWVADENTIYLRNDISDTLMFSTLIHEVMHVMNSTMEHAFLDSLAEQLSQVLLDNGLSSLR